MSEARDLCHVAALGFAYGKLTECDQDSASEVTLSALREIENAIISSRAQSLTGALAQVLQLYGAADRLHSYVDPASPPQAHERAAFVANSRRVLRDIDRMLFSVAAVLEREAGLRMEELGSEYCFPREHDPHADKGREAA